MKNIYKGIITTIIGVIILIFSGVLLFVPTHIEIDKLFITIIACIGLLLLLSPDSLITIIKKKLGNNNQNDESDS